MSKTQTLRAPNDEHAGAVGSRHRASVDRGRSGLLEAIATIQTQLATLVRESTSERLPAGHWIVICPEDLLGRIVDATVRVEGLIHELRHARTSAHDSPGQRLIARLGVLCARFTAETAIRCECTIDPNHTRFDAHVCDVVYWTIRELLTNVHRHARATLVKVSSGLREDGCVYLRVEDNGVGAVAPGKPSPPYGMGGLGLWSIEHHLNQLDISLDIISDRGFSVTIALPSWLVLGG